MSHPQLRLIVFDYDGRQLTRIDRSPSSERSVGIWWQQGDTLLACQQLVEMLAERGPLLDTDLSHDEVWPTASPLLDCPEETEYFDVPRGRVLYDARERRGVIYHGNATPREALERLAEVFGLPHWEDRLDEHYLTGDALELFFSLDEPADDEPWTDDGVD